MNYFIEKYDKEKIYVFQSGEIANYERIKNIFPGIDNMTYIVFTDYTKNIIISIEPLNLKRTELNIDPKLSENDAISRISDILTQQDRILVEDTTRIADALEDLVVLNMPDEEV